MIGPKICYLGLPKSGSTSLYNFIPSTSKGHEIDINALINVAYRQEYNGDTSSAISYLKLRYMYYRLEYDICTMFSLFPKSVVDAYTNTHFVSIVREPVEWSFSFINYAAYVSENVKPKSHTLYWDLLPKMLNPSNYAGESSISLDWEKIFESTLDYWLTATLASVSAMATKTSFIVKLSDINDNLDNLNEFLGGNNTIMNAPKFPRLNMSSDRKMCKRAYRLSQNNCTESDYLKRHRALEYYHDMESRIIYNL